jgi:hypothetical protein
LDQRHQEKRKVLETRLGKICNIVRPLIDNQYLFKQVMNKKEKLFEKDNGFYK